MDEVEMNNTGTKKKTRLGEKKEENAQGGRFTGKFPALYRIEEDDRQSARHLEGRRRRAAPHPATTDNTMRD